MMNVAKLQASDGTVVWEMTHDAGSGAEAIAFTDDGGFIVCGYIESEYQAAEQNFKSAGQVEEATPFVAKVSAADAAGDSAPTSFEWEWSETGEEFTGSAKTIRLDSDGNIYTVIGKSAVVKLDSSGTEVWNAGYMSNIQLNDLELASDGLVAIGHQYIN